MAERPWVTPEELIEATSDPSVKERSPTQLERDIRRAERYIMAYCNDTFADPDKYPQVPVDIADAVILIAEIYAARAAASANGRGTVCKSESLDDYSYTMQETDAAIDNMILGPLLDPYVVKKVRHGIKMDGHAW